MSSQPPKPSDARTGSDQRLTSRALRYWRSPAATGMVLLAIAVGLASGYGAAAFHWLTIGARHLFFDLLRPALDPLGPLGLVLLPALGGLLVGPLVAFVAREARGHGVPEIILAVAHQGGRIRPRVALVKGLAAALSIGSGGSAGQHGPAVQIGSGLGSMLGQVLRLPAERMSMLAACGAAGGIAATFNAPIGGVLFALEVILRNFTTRSFGIVVISSVSAVVISHAYLGDRPAFHVPTYSLVSAWEFPLYAVLGAAAAITAHCFTWILYTTGDLFDALPTPDWVKPAIGGLAVGAIGLWLPEVFGVGYEFTESVLLGQVGIRLLLALLLFKLVATSFTLGSGGSGGVFAPALFLGAMLGGAFGQIAHAAQPNLTAAAGAYALVGMGAVFAGAARAPMTAIIILFEMTRDYRIIGPLMLATIVSTLLSEALNRNSIYTLKLARRGVDILGAEPDILDTIPVSQAMEPDVPTVAPELPVADIVERFAAGRTPSIPVLDSEGRLVGIVARSDAEEAVLRGDDTALTSDIMTPDPLTCYADESLTLALQRLTARDISTLPVVDPTQDDRLVGVLRRRDIIEAYQRTRRERPEFAARIDRLRDSLTGARILDLEVDAGSPAADQEVQALPIPHEALLAAVRRGGRTLIPHGDTVLRAGDRVTVVAEREQFDALRALFTRRPPGQ
jgi:CIC family chloride channel protein